MRSKLFRFTFAKAVPIVVSYLFLGLAAGVLLAQAGYAPYWATISALLIYGVGLCMLGYHVDTLNDNSVFLSVDNKDFSFLSLIFTGDNYYLIACF